VFVIMYMNNKVCHLMWWTIWHFLQLSGKCNSGQNLGGTVTVQMWSSEMYCSCNMFFSSVGGWLGFVEFVCSIYCTNSEFG
jgi:hypothetical protein